MYLPTRNLRALEQLGRGNLFRRYTASTSADQQN